MALDFDALKICPFLHQQRQVIKGWAVDSSDDSNSTTLVLGGKTPELLTIKCAYAFESDTGLMKSQGASEIIFRGNELYPQAKDLVHTSSGWYMVWTQLKSLSL